MDIKNERERFSRYIKQKGLRFTRQREEVLETFLSSERHVTVEELFNQIKTRNSEIGFATVYRNMGLLCECGLAEEIKIGSQKARYEPVVERGHHDHLVCVKCGKLIEVVDENIEKLQNLLAEENGFFPLRHKLEIYGICRECRLKEE